MVKFSEYLTSNFIPFRATYQEGGDEVFKRFGVRSTPTVMIVDPAGQEIDRVIGYDNDAEVFKSELEAAYKDKDNFLALSQAHENNPDDLRITALLSHKYISRRNTDEVEKLAVKLLSDEAAAKEMMLPLGPEKEEVSVYEFAKFTTTYNEPRKTAEFLHEFPNSSGKEQAFRNLSRFLSSKEYGEQAVQIYDILFENYTGDRDLIAPYISWSARNEKDVERSIKLAEQIHKVEAEGTADWVAQSYARLLLHNGETKRAAEIYGDNFLKLYIEEKDAGALNGFGWFWALQKENLQSALKAAKESLKLKDDANTWDTLSMVYWKMGKHKKAVEAEEKALEMVGGSNKDFEERIKKIEEDMKK